MDHPPSLLGKRYVVERTIGRGTFASVCMGRTGQQRVALKRIRLRNLNESVKETYLREVLTLRQIDHPNVVRLVDAFPDGRSYVLVLELMSCSLRRVLDSLREPLPLSLSKAYMTMILRGAAHLHRRSVVHRDIKPGNILVSVDGQRLKLSDFGLARVVDRMKTRSMTPFVATRWYRAPELLYGSRTYAASADVWACGCVWAEMMTLLPPFRGDNDIDQLHRIFSVLGTPTDRTWPEAKNLPDFEKISFGALPAVRWRDAFPEIPKCSLGLIEGLLRLDPKRRISASEALRDTHFFLHPLPSQAGSLPKYMLA